MPENKEPRFFCGYSMDTFEFGKKHFHPEIVSTETNYLALFRDAPAGAISGESSTDYLSCPQAASRIHAWDPSIKIIIMLRNPIDRAYSEYQHSISGGFQTNTFWESLCLEEERFQQHYDPVFWHVRRGLYFEGVKKYIELFGKDRVRVILFEEFARSTAAVVESVFEFLDVSTYPVDVSERHNAKAEAVGQINLGLFSIKPVRHMIRIVGKFIGHKMKTKMFRKISVKTTVHDELTDKQYKFLCEKFKVDILNLQKLLGENLEHWLR